MMITKLEPKLQQLTNLHKDSSKIVRKEYISTLTEFYHKHHAIMTDTCNFIAQIDYLVSGACVAKEYAYCKPIIPSLKRGEKKLASSYIKSRSLRNAIVERLCQETEYIPNNVVLGNCKVDNMDANGILLYGLNSCGKSTTMKAIGIAVILAQIGYYVPATSFEFEPYQAIYARITGNDNCFKGLSSFALEMSELSAILTRSASQGTNTLVIGDEVCRGTEDTSGRALVASTLVELSESSTSFIFSSHLHDIPSIPEVANLTNLRIYHLRVEYDSQRDCLVFDRKLTPGSGPSVYGLTVAKFLVKNSRFINRAETIKNRLMTESVAAIPTKSSRYNKDLPVTSCTICSYMPRDENSKELETHHIHFQKDCLHDGKIKEKPYLNKNRLSNLVVLCRPCHMKVHSNEITINGYIDTSIGVLLDYHKDPIKTLSSNMSILATNSKAVHHTHSKRRIRS